MIGLFKAGMTGMRLNLSHIGLEDSADVISTFRHAAKQAGVRPQLIIDLQGPELRVDKLPAPIELQAGNTVILGNAGIPVPEAILPALANGMEILLDDGAMLLKVNSCNAVSASCKVIRGGLLESKKSVAIPEANICPSVLTDDDFKNLALAGDYGVTAVLQPFVRMAQDIVALRQTLGSLNLPDIRIIAKIENREGVCMLNELIEHADEICIARGDLGTDMPLWELPAVQKEIAKFCNEKNKPFSVATQMLHSMITSPVPTRAEVSDIFNAVLDGATALILTGEVAVGRYPVESMRYLCKTAEQACIYLNLAVNQTQRIGGPS